ncbi:MAG: SAM-dependent chlorinase/fluorinase [Thermodesulfovibrionia bacterium]
MQKRIITLTTDFGLKDPFVGIMKGVIIGINPDAYIIDITHNITRHNIFEASQTLLMSYRYFPRDTVHVVIVDPGVGSERRPILVIMDNCYFVGPDNGVFSPIYEEASGSLTVIHLTSTHYFMPVRGSTFHGRDIFAPVAAWLSRGIDTSRLGEEITDYVKLPSIKATIEGKTIKGNIITIDIFGNAITNITRDDVEKLAENTPVERLMVVFKGKAMNMVDYYAKAKETTLSCLFNSFGNLELFVFKGSASEMFDINIGDSVVLTVID